MAMPDSSHTTPPVSETGSAPDVTVPDLWHARDVDPHVGGPHFGRLAGAMQELQDRFTGACLPSELVEQVTAQLESLTSTFAAHQVDETHAPAGARNDLPGRGSVLFPRFRIDETGETSSSGHVMFTRFHLGGNGAAHGGTLALLFDDIMGHLISTRGLGVFRTAYLTVNFRKVALIDRPLRFDVTIDRIEGRKGWLSARVHDGDVVVSDAEGLFIRLLPGQP